MKTFWTFILDEERYDGEFESAVKAQERADELFAEQCQECSPANTEAFSEEIQLVEFNEDGDILVAESTVDYTHYHGDFAEHNVWHSGGVL